MAFKKNEYPEWVEKYRAKGRTIRKTKDGYALYHVTSEYRRGQAPRQIQEYLGKITEEDGFVPKRTDKERRFIEYGLSHMIWCSMRREIVRHFVSPDYDMVRIAIVMHVFGSSDAGIMGLSYLTYSDADRLAGILRKLSPESIERCGAAVDNALRRRIGDGPDLLTLERLLMLCVVEPGPGSSRKPSVPGQASALMEKYGLRYE